ncbi:hypothetical protein [Candidatus Accumulibacter sp. ACC007]|uniref:hypothetical protein n=1 Tax=Candidatus Accumulibacter sp. ACC007 TaxID=2823333 RepID=UPI0025BB9E02|nr:hypothetical protein [Candidatus Accumulibacter sp. ACC007]
MIAKVDIAARQVMIEARIVEAGDSFAKNLGVRLGWRQTFPDGAVSVGGGAVSGQLDMAERRSTCQRRHGPETPVR